MCQLATEERRWYIVGYYLAPGDGTTIRDVEAEMGEQPRGAELIVAGDLNADLERTGGRGRDKDITAVVATAGLEDLRITFSHNGAIGVGSGGHGRWCS